MPSEVLNLTAQIVISHAAMTELSSKELVAEIKDIYNILASLDKEVAVPVPQPAAPRPRRPRQVKMKLSSEAKAVLNEEGLPVGDPDYMEFMESREG